MARTKTPPAPEFEAVEMIDLLKSRSNLRLSGLMRTLGTTGATLDTVFPFDETHIDSTRMSVGPVVISNTAEDRYQDVVDPRGVDIANYIKNPIVMLDHGRTYELPIARSADENDNLTLIVGDNEIQATAFFSKSTPEAYQSFGLVNEGILRGTSIHINPTEAHRRSPGTPQGGRPGFLVTAAEMLEWSFGALPVNQDCVAKILKSQKIGNESLCEPIRKLLLPLAPTVKKTGRGWTPPKETPMALAKTDSMGGDDDLSNTEQDADDRPYGQQVGSAARESLKSLHDQLQDAMAKMEHPEVREHLAALAEAVGGHVAELDKCMKMYYPGSDSLSKSEDEEEPDDKDKEENLQKFLRLGRMNQLRIGGIAHFLKTTALAKNINATQKQVLIRAAGTIEKSLNEVKADQKAPASMVGSVKKLLDRVEQFEKRLELMIPKNRN